MAAEDDESKHEKGNNDIQKEDVRNEAVGDAVDHEVKGQANVQDAPRTEKPEVDEFGLPVKPPRRKANAAENKEEASKSEDENEVFEEAVETTHVDDEKAETDDIKTNEHASQPTKGSIDEVSKGDDSPIKSEALTNDESHAKGKEPADGSALSRERSKSLTKSKHAQKASMGASEWSHQQLAPQQKTEDQEDEEEDQWQEMPALATHRIYDDWGKVLAKEYGEVEDETVAYGTLGGAGKGYTRVQIDEDAQSATSLDDTTAYLFKDGPGRTNTLVDDDDDESRDLVSQMQTTKELLTEGQRIAYVGLVRLSLVQMAADIEALDKTKGAKKLIEHATEATRMWAQKTMVHLYSHMEIDSQEQVMVEQLADHGVLPSDLTPALMQNARVKNKNAVSNVSSSRQSVSSPPSVTSPSLGGERNSSIERLSMPGTPGEAPPAYEEHAAADLTVKDASEVMNAKNIDLDLRWTVLCDLFLLLIAGSVYDARSRTLLERVGTALSVEWQEICRFEKRVTDALEVQEQSADKENWNEEEHMKSREKRARNKRLVVMGLCTVGGGLVIGLSAGMLAPVIGAGLAAGFSGIGIAGTGTFLGGTGAAALIGTTGTLIGSHIGLKGSARRTGAVKTFEYRPLYNNKRVNLIITVSGWMTGKVDDVRLPFSTVDPIMGDIYSVNWEPEMLQSTGQTIQILGTEALTQTIQQILGATFLATLMAGLSLPLVLSKLAYLIDNPWTVSLARADATGLILADSIIDRNLGVRPITLVGFSLGSRVIFSCLRELSRRGAWGLIQNVYIFGSPVVVNKDEWSKARSVVSGRFVNGYATNDWILAYLFRATSGGIMRVAGLASVEIHGIENINVTETVPGHMAYRGMMPTLLEQVGWQVESLEFSEIEDPDPENHEKRQRELLNEIEEARRELEQKPEKKGFKSFFSRKKASQKKDWETYDERSMKIIEGEDADESERVASENANVLFDVDAIRKEALELAMEGGDIDEIKSHLQIREITSTMPALKVSLPEKDAETGACGSKSAFDRRFTHDGSFLTNGTPTEALSPGTYDTRRYDDDAGEITLSFDSPEASPKPITPAFVNGSARSVSSSLVPSPDPSAPDSSWSPSNRGVFERPRPSIARNPATAPESTTDALGIQRPRQISRSPGRNPWNEEEEFGKEQDVEMSFE
ncbi:putative membrane protein c6f6.13c [Acrodontium crateriforme]|uniref:Membrane protein c6f6.13c n=1 Tax=Acrodontium crateriforme TaxID=150365 RepID=A0AAQ3RAY4_9PEZI|nr:putative membrane protein c6f6.13c [Acrodontium crateriforme]